MEILKEYLQYVQEDSNPYNYKAIDLDSNITPVDLSMLRRHVALMQNYLGPEDPLEPERWVSNPNYTSRQLRAYVIVDRGRRVGVVGVKRRNLTWVSWVPGHSYAARGTMKMIEKLWNEKFFHSNLKALVANIYKKNIPSYKTALKLKMHIEDKSPTHYYCELRTPFWWIKK
jgi:hypothetical protein